VAAVFTAAVMAVVVGATVIARPGQRAAGAGVLLLAVPLTALFIKADRRATAPFLPAAALRLLPLRRGAAGSFLNTAATSSAMTLATLYLQDTLHRSPLQAAATLVPFSLAVVAGSALAAPALRRIGPQPALATGLAVIAAADAALTVAAPHPWALPASAATAGAGLGLSSVAATALGTTVPEVLRARHQGSSTRPPSSAPLSASPPCCSSRTPPPAPLDPAQNTGHRLDLAPPGGRECR
jgi:Na+/melibiose symporter-like transporter